VLSRELMGILCLGVVWVTALLVAAAALQDLADLRRIARRAKKAIVGVAQADIAEWKVELTARAIDVGGDEAITFHERRFVSDILGGTVLMGDSSYEVSPSEAGQVWLSAEARALAVSCSDTATFDEIYARARKAKGASHDACVRVGKGERVFVVGEVDGRAIKPQIISTIDPLVFCKVKAGLIALFIPLELAACALATALALSQPHFGRASTAGAICCIAFFLGVTPIAVALRERARRPHEAFLRVTWSRKALEPARAKGLTQRKT
jgi:hypothetical protein